MFETISVPRKVIETNVNDAFPFVSKISDISDIKQYRERISEYKEYRMQCFDKGFRVSDLLNSQTKSLDDFLKKIFEKCVWNATPRSLSPLERNIGFWTQA